MNQIIFTMDTDWTPPEALEYVFSEVIDPRLAVTAFCTDRYPSAERRLRTEVGLHYNVEKLGFEKSYRAMAALLPDAKGARGHSLAVSERLRALYRELGTTYDSSYLMYGQQNIFAFPVCKNIWELPIYFMDTCFMEFHAGDLSQAPSQEQLDGPGLKVLDFHPVHLILNTPTLEYYQSVKVHYHNLDALLAHQYTGQGIRTLFLQWQDWVLSQNHPQLTLLELANSLNAAKMVA